MTDGDTLKRVEQKPRRAKPPSTLADATQSRRGQQHLETPRERVATKRPQRVRPALSKTSRRIARENKPGALRGRARRR
jgi:hypothetical protein